MLCSTSQVFSAKLSLSYLYLDNSQNGFRIILHHHVIPTRSVYTVNRGRREKTMRWIDEELSTNEGTINKVLDRTGMCRDCSRALGTGQQLVLASEEGGMRWTCSSIRNRVLLDHKTRRQSEELSRSTRSYGKPMSIFPAPSSELADPLFLSLEFPRFLPFCHFRLQRAVLSFSHPDPLRRPFPPRPLTALHFLSATTPFDRSLFARFPSRLFPRYLPLRIDRRSCRGS